MKLKCLFAASVALVLAGCATSAQTIVFDATRASTFQGRTLVPVTQTPPGMVPMRASSAAFAGLGGLAMGIAARTYAQEHGVVDPAPQIEERLTSLLQTRYGLQASSERLDLSNVTERASYPTNEGVLYVDAKTYMWMQRYYPPNWGRFRIDYYVLIQIVDGSNGQPVAQYDCKKTSHDSADNAPSLEELEASNSALTNRLLVEMANACAAEFETIALGGVQ
jgi:hypothetical protein